MLWTEWDDSVSAERRRAEAIAANEAFVAAMNKAIKRRKEKVKPGIFVDTTPPINARRIRGHLPMSFAGSPGAMCLEGGQHSGAQSLK